MVHMSYVPMKRYSPESCGDEIAQHQLPLQLKPLGTSPEIQGGGPA
jgi:hypothetical protein